MILAINTPAVSNPISVPSATASGNALSGGSSLAKTNSPCQADELSLSQSGPLTLTDGTYQRTSWKIRARSEVKVTDDGDVRVMSQTKLRFRYTFEAADGTSIRIRVQANLDYSTTTDSEDGSQSTRLRATARVSILQENVSSGIAPLLETPDISAESKQIISQAMDLFQQVIDATTSAFLDSDPLDGDRLIAGLVEAFNELSASIDSMFLSSPAAPEAVPSGEVVELLEQAATDPGEVLAGEPAQTAVTPLVHVEPAPRSVEPPQGTASSNGPETELVNAVGQEDTPATTNDVLPVAGEHEAADAGQQVALATDQQTRSFVGSVLMRVRLQVIQSLSSLVDAFDADSSSLQVSRSIFRASAQISARYNVRGSDANDSLSHANSVDTHG